MKVLEIIYSVLLIILAVSLTIWQIIQKSPIFVICFLAVMSIMAVLVLFKVIQEFREEKMQKKSN